MLKEINGVWIKVISAHTKRGKVWEFSWDEELNKFTHVTRNNTYGILFKFNNDNARIGVYKLIRRPVEDSFWVEAYVRFECLYLDNAVITF